MATNEELRVQITATDKASRIIDGAADKAEHLEKVDPEVDIDAKDDASDEIADIRDKLERLDGDEAEALLKAEKRKAEADVKAFRRELLDVDNETAEAEIRADKSQAQSRVDAINDELDKLDETVVEPTIDGESAGGAGGLAAGKSFLTGLGASGMVAGVAAALEAGFDLKKMRARFKEQFDLVNEDAERLGKESGQLYSDGWGDSEEAVLNSLGHVQRGLVKTGLIADTETKGIARGALAISDVFDKDVSETVRAVGQLMKNGLAPSAEAALDVITSGLKGGADQADDFYDTINEYSQHFAGFGLSAKDMTDIIQSGFQSGQRDADKLADAVKEMRIRTVEESATISAAYKSLGLNADDYREKILAGGPDARLAFQQILAALKTVDDPVEQQRLAIELIGTQYEDLGPTALEVLSDIESGTVSVTGATDDMADSLEESSSEVDKLKRRFTSGLNVALEEAATKTNEWIAELDADEIDVTRERVDQLKESMRFLGATEDEVRRATGDLHRENYTLAQSMIQNEIDAALAEKALDEWAGSLVQAKTDTGELVASLGDLKGALDLEDALWSAEDRFGRAMTQIRDSTTDPRRAVNDMKQSVLDFAEAADDVPESAITEIIAHIDAGSFRVAEARLKVLTARQTKIIDVYTSTGSGGSGTYTRMASVAPSAVAQQPQVFASTNTGGATLVMQVMDGNTVRRTVNATIDERDAAALAEFGAELR